MVNMVDELPNMSFMNSDMMGEMPGLGQGSGGAQQRIRRRNRMITSCKQCCPLVQICLNRSKVLNAAGEN